MRTLTRVGGAGWALLAAALLVAPPAVEAQVPAKVWRVAVLSGASPREGAWVRALEQRLAELG